jgi:toxin ParE1/3/4
MSYRLRIRLAAEADVAEAAQWYNERQVGLGEKFVREVDQAIGRILENPFAFPVILRRHEVRRALTKRFPYRIFFSLKDDAVRPEFDRHTSNAGMLQSGMPHLARFLEFHRLSTRRHRVLLRQSGGLKRKIPVPSRASLLWLIFSPFLQSPLCSHPKFRLSIWLR